MFDIGRGFRKRQENFDRTPERAFIWDETLRGGDQTPGVGFTVRDKLDIASMMDDMGVSVIDAGFPMMGEGEREAIRSLAGLGLKAEVGATVRTEKEDVDAAIDCGVENIYMFSTTSPLHLRYKYGIDEEEVKRRIHGALEYALSRGVNVDFITEDTSRSNFGTVIDILEDAAELGVRRIILCDTVSIMTPMSIYSMVSSIMDGLQERLEDKGIKRHIPFGVHCHNDFGLATANTAAAVVAGAEYPTLAVNSLGDGSGNASMEEVVMILEKLYGIDTGMDTTGLYSLSKLVEGRSGIYLSPQKPISGLNSYRHESEVHVSGVLKNPEVYEPIQPEEVGRTREFIPGKHTGPIGIGIFLREMGIEASDEEKEEMLRRMREEKARRPDDEIDALFRHMDEYADKVLSFPRERIREIAEEVLKKVR